MHPLPKATKHKHSIIISPQEQAQAGGTCRTHSRLVLILKVAEFLFDAVNALVDGELEGWRLAGVLRHGSGRNGARSLAGLYIEYCVRNWL